MVIAYLKIQHLITIIQILNFHSYDLAYYCFQSITHRTYLNLVQIQIELIEIFY